MIDGLPVLTFHTLDDIDRSAIAFPPAVFARALETLHRRGAQTLDMVEMAARLRRGVRLPPRAVVLTFDDGYRSVYEVAFPLLQRYGLRATVFLTVGQQGAIPSSPLPSMNSRPMLSWHEIRAMHREGITFGAHTLTHRDLTRLPRHEVQAEIGASKARIEDALGAQVACFAYPYGCFDRRSREIVAEHFACACSDRLGLVTAASDLYAMERVDACYLRTAPLFDAMFTEVFSWYVRARSIPRLVRRRLRAVVSRSLDAHEEAVHGR